jgi:hypothetical protein
MQFEALWGRPVAFAGTVVVTGLLLLCGCAFGAIGIGVGSTSAADVPLSPYVSARHSAKAAKVKVEYVNIELNLNITAVKGNIIYAEGVVSGKFKGPASLHLDLVNASRSEASFTAREPHGSLYGSGPANYRVSGSVSYFSGGTPSMSGTGKYQKIKGAGVKMTGSMNRRTLKIVIHMTGKFYA